MREDHHYEIDLPFRNSKVNLPDNSQQAINRLKWLEKRMRKKPKFNADYSKFMNSLLKGSYAERVPENELCKNYRKVWYIPHHGVYHPRKVDKFRVVFDCTATFNEISLSSLLLPEPNLVNNLVGVLLRFRSENIAIAGDIEKMFYQVRMPSLKLTCYASIGGLMETFIKTQCPSECLSICSEQPAHLPVPHLP